MSNTRGGRWHAGLLLAVGLALLLPAHAVGLSFGSWSPAQPVPGAVNEPDSLEGCPILSADGKSLFIASNRAGGQGGLDIWVAHRSSPEDPWGEPENLGPRINTADDEFCPGPTRNGKTFYFIRNPGECGGADIFVTRLHPLHGWAEPENVGCEVNSAGDEASPAYLELDGTEVLFFSSNRPGGFAAEPVGQVPDNDIYMSVRGPDGSWQAPALVAGVNSEFEDVRPNVRRDGLEIVFDSNRPQDSFGLFDIWSATRPSLSDPFATPQNLGAAINSAANETRASLSWFGDVLVFGSTRSGSPDVYTSTRTR
jgi:hypothetical protein